MFSAHWKIEMVQNSSLKTRRSKAKIFIIDIEYCLFNKSRNVISTNATDEVLIHLLESWIAGQAGQAEDFYTMDNRGTYKVRIELNLSAGDTFSTQSDTDSKSLTCGIVMASLFYLKRGEITVEKL